VGDTVIVGQAGGIWKGEAHQEAGNALLRVGQRYLLDIHKYSFFEPESTRVNGYLLTKPFGQFEVGENDRLRPKDEEWAHLPAVAELTGLTVEDAQARLRNIVRATPIPDSVLLGELAAIPIPPGTFTDGGPIIGRFDGNEAGSDFYGNVSVDEVLSFYASTLEDGGWTLETGPTHRTYPDLPNDGYSAFRTVNASYVKGQLRLMLAADLTEPPRNWTGLTGWILRLQPIWYSGFDSTTAPSAVVNNTPIPIGSDYANP
jgi:hypothetical protein